MRVALVSALCVSACFAPDISGVRCSPEGLCPTGQVCDLDTRTCHRPGVQRDAGVDGAGTGDRDDDNVVDAEDNCPDLANPDQADEDGDRRGDACDNCPGTANPDQTDTMELDSGEPPDGVGDVCDPRPTSGGDSIHLFEPFATLEAWEVAEGDAEAWSVVEGKAIQSSAEPAVHHLMLSGAQLRRVAVSTRFTALEIPPGTDNSPRSAGVLALYGPDGAPEGQGYACTYFDDTNNAATELVIFRLNTLVVALERIETEELETNDSYQVRLMADGEAGRQACTGITDQALAMVQSADGLFSSGSVGIRTDGISAAFDHVTVFALGD